MSNLGEEKGTFYFAMPKALHFNFYLFTFITSWPAVIGTNIFQKTLSQVHQHATMLQTIFNIYSSSQPTQCVVTRRRLFNQINNRFFSQTITRNTPPIFCDYWSVTKVKQLHYLDVCQNLSESKCLQLIKVSYRMQLRGCSHSVTRSNWCCSLAVLLMHWWG